MANTPAPIPANKADQDSRIVSRSTWIVSAITMLSRLLGLLRDYCLIALFGGTPWVTDAFIFAFTLPNLFRRLFGEGALSAAFIPQFVSTRENQDAATASNLASSVLTLLVLVTGGLAAVGIVLCLAAESAFDTNTQLSLTLRLAAIMLPFLCLVCCSALLSGMLQSLRSFALPAAMSIILNLCFLTSFAYITYKTPSGDSATTIYYVAYAVVAAGLIQILLQLPALLFQGVALRPRFAFSEEGVTSVVRAMGPTALGLGVVQVNVLLDNLIAYYLSLTGATGANTYLYLGNRLMQLPLGVFGIAVATTVFPFLSSHASRDEHKEMLTRIETAVRMLLFVIAPASVGLAVVAVPVVQMIFQKPDLVFSDLAVYRTSAVLVCYAGGLCFFSLQHLLTRAFYALKDYRTPIRIAVYMVGVNLALNLLLIRVPDQFRRWRGDAFEHAWQLSNANDFPINSFLGTDGLGLAEAGLALATTITALINVLLLWNALRKRLSASVGEEVWEKVSGNMQWSAARIIIAAAIMGVGVYFAVNSIPYEPELFARIERGIAPVILGALGYWIICMVIPVPELEEFLGRRKKAQPPSSNATK